MAVSLEQTIAGRYRIEAELARGGMGVVYSALDTTTEGRVALKRLLQEAASNQHIAHLFRQEYHTLVSLQHPRIIQVFDYGVDAEGAYYTMELLDGADLRDLAPLDYREACRHLRDVASSLALLHARHWLHRDLNARNVRLTKDGRAKLLDFGALATFGVAGQVVGTPPLIPPEAATGQSLDQRSDLYSLGALAYWLVTGRHAYPATRLQMLPGLWREGPPALPSRLVEGIPGQFDDLVSSLLQLDARSRPSSAAEVIERLNVIGQLESEETIDVGRGYLSSPQLVGRSDEVGQLQAFVERVLEGRSAGLLLEGEAGIGKTRLVEEAAVQAQLGGALVIRVDGEVSRGPYAVARKVASELLTAAPEIARPAAKEHARTLAHVVSELRAEVPGDKLPSLGVDRNEQRVLIQTAFFRWLECVGRQKPLVVTIENAHAVDEASLAIFSLLPRRAAACGVGVLVTTRPGEDGSARALSLTHDTLSVISLRGLSERNTIALVRALFGDVDHVGRLGGWLRERTDGNPMQCIALATQLIVDDQIRYRDGAWLLPAELDLDQLPSGMSQILERRVARLSPSARELAEALSVEEGIVALEHCVALAAMDPDALFSAFAELVENDLLVSVGDGYRFSQTALRRYLYASLASERRRALHGRAGAHLLDVAGDDPAPRIEAGWHLLRAGQESRGAELLAALGEELVKTIEGLALAAPGVEAALEVFEQQGRSKWQILNVLDVLTSAGWYVDRKYAVRYGERTLDMALDVSGVALGTRLSRFLGESTGAKVGAGVAAVRHGFSKKGIEVDRFKEFIGTFAPLIGGLGILIGVAANSFDPPSARKILERVRVLRAFPKGNIVEVMYDYARYYALLTEGRQAEAEPIGLRVLDWFQTEPAFEVLGRSGAKALSGGMMTGLALSSALSGGDAGLRWAERLETLGLSFYALMGTQARLVHHAHRGETAEAARYLEQLELNAIQGGTTWQTSIFIPFILTIAYAITGELARLRTTTEQLERLAEDIPSLDCVARFSRGAYQYWRGYPQQAVELFEGVRRDFLPYRHLLWPLVRSMHVRALLATGQKAEALDLARDATSQLRESEENLGTIHLDLGLAVALAEAESGNEAVAIERVERLIDKHRPIGGPLPMVIAHETRARIALAQGDRDAFHAHTEEVGHWAKVADDPALIAKWKRLQAEGRDATTGVSLESQHPAPTSSAYASAVRSVIGHRDAAERSREALRLLMDESNAARGHLYLGAPPDLELVARAPEDGAPSAAAEQRLRTLADSVGGARVPGGIDMTMMTQTVGPSDPATSIDTVSSLAEGTSLHLLVVSRKGRPAVVGGVVLELGSDGVPPTYALLGALAESLSAAPNAPDVTVTVSGSG